MTLVNSNCAVKEIVHRLSKQAVPKTNRKNVEFDLIRHTNVLQAIRYVIDGGIDDRFDSSNVGDGLRKIITDLRLQSLLTGWYMTEDLYPENVSEEGNFLLILLYLITYSIIIKLFDNNKRCS